MVLVILFPWHGAIWPNGELVCCTFGTKGFVVVVVAVVLVAANGELLRPLKFDVLNGDVTVLAVPKEDTADVALPNGDAVLDVVLPNS